MTVSLDFGRGGYIGHLCPNIFFDKQLRKYGLTKMALAQDLHINSHCVVTRADEVLKITMVSRLSELEEVNVLASEANWAWPQAVHDIFQPRGVNLLVAQSVSEFVNVIEQKRIHATIVDMDSEKYNGLATIKIIRMDYPLLPCILLSSRAGEEVLSKALRLDVFGVINKPVDMTVLLGLLNRLFIKKYDSNIFK